MSLDANYTTLKNVSINPFTVGTQSNGLTSTNVFGNNQAMSYLFSPERLNAYIMMDNAIMNPKFPTATISPTQTTIDPALMSQIQNLLQGSIAMQALGNRPIMPQFGDSIPYGMNKMMWQFPFDMYPGSMTMPTFPNIRLGSIPTINPFMYNVQTIRPSTNIRAGVNTSISAGGLGSPFKAIGGTLEGIGDTLLNWGGWNCSA